MKTLFLVLGVVAVAALGGAAGYDYASNGELGLLPACCTGCCEGSACPGDEDCSVSGETPTARQPPCCLSNGACAPGESEEESAPSCCEEETPPAAVKK